MAISDCYALLLDGVFQSTTYSSDVSLGENYSETIHKMTYQEYLKQSQAGFNIGLPPIGGIPFSVGANGQYSQQTWNNWKEQYEQTADKESIYMSSEKLVKEKADPDLLDAFSNCIEANSKGFHLYTDYLSDASSTPSVNLIFTPLFMSDPEITFVSLSAIIDHPGVDPQVMTVKIVDPPAVGTPIFTTAHNVKIIRPELLSDDKWQYPGVTVVATVTTANGDVLTDDTFIRPYPRPKPISPPFPKIQAFTKRSEKAQHPKVQFYLSDQLGQQAEQYKVIGGGAMVDWKVYGLFLTGSRPLYTSDGTPIGWEAQAKDLDLVEQAVLTVNILAIHDPEDVWEVKVLSEMTEHREPHPNGRCFVSNEYVMTCGGAWADWEHGQSGGSYLTASYPISRDTWIGESKDHKYPFPTKITVYAIGIRARNGADALESYVSDPPLKDSGSHTEQSINVDRGYKMVGGGAKVDYHGGYGNMLTASYFDYPNQTEWTAKSKDHIVISEATLSVYVVGLRQKLSDDID